MTHSKNEVVHTNKKHPFLTLEHGFLSVAQVTVGMHIERADGTLGTVTAWKLVPGVKTMYNLEVAQDHTFTVGAGQWIVHNCAAGDSQPTRNQMFQQAKRDAGIPTSQSPSRQGWINKSAINNKFIRGGEPARIYEFSAEGGKKYIIEHLFDGGGRGPHFHVGEPKEGVDMFQDGAKYFNLGKDEDYSGILDHYPTDFGGFSR